MSSKLLVAGLLASSMMAAPAMAAVDIAGTFDVNAYTGTNNGLTIDITNNNGIPLFTLGNTPESFTLFTISTPESDVKWGEDTQQKNISVSFNFTDPSDATGAPITGTTNGVNILGIFQYGNLSWNGPQIFDFGNGGQFEVTLSDATFNGGIGGLWTGSADVSGTFRLLNDSTPAVPEPATWAMMIGGFGLIGAAMRRRQKISVTYA
jgi:hypothetical protein